MVIINDKMLSDKLLRVRRQKKKKKKKKEILAVSLNEKAHQHKI